MTPIPYSTVPRHYPYNRYDIGLIAHLIVAIINIVIWIINKTLQL